MNNKPRRHIPSYPPEGRDPAAPFPDRCITFGDSDRCDHDRSFYEWKLRDGDTVSWCTACGSILQNQLRVGEWLAPCNLPNTDKPAAREVPRCRNCKYWRPVRQTVGGLNSVGTCCRYSPSPEATPPRDGVRRFVGVFPLTRPEDWCGDHLDRGSDFIAAPSSEVQDALFIAAPPDRPLTTNEFISSNLTRQEAEARMAELFDRVETLESQMRTCQTDKFRLADRISDLEGPKKLGDVKP